MTHNQIYHFKTQMRSIVLIMKTGDYKSAFFDDMVNSALVNASSILADGIRKRIDENDHAWLSRFIGNFHKSIKHSVA